MGKGRPTAVPQHSSRRRTTRRATAGGARSSRPASSASGNPPVGRSRASASSAIATSNASSSTAPSAVRAENVDHAIARARDRSSAATRGASSSAAAACPHSSSPRPRNTCGPRDIERSRPAEVDSGRMIASRAGGCRRGRVCPRRATVAAVPFRPGRRACGRRRRVGAEPRARAFEERIARRVRPAPRFDGRRGFARRRRSVRRRTGSPSWRREPGRSRVAGGLVAAQLMVEMRDGDELRAPRHATTPQQESERDRIGAPGHGGDERACRSQQPHVAGSRASTRAASGVMQQRVVGALHGSARRTAQRTEIGAGAGT